MRPCLLVAPCMILLPGSKNSRNRLSRTPFAGYFTKNHLSNPVCQSLTLLFNKCFLRSGELVFMPVRINFLVLIQAYAGKCNSFLLAPSYLWVNFRAITLHDFWAGVKLLFTSCCTEKEQDKNRPNCRHIIAWCRWVNVRNADET